MNLQTNLFLVLLMAFTVNLITGKNLDVIEIAPSQNFTIGYLRENSVLLVSERLTANATENQTVSDQFQFSWGQDLHMIQAIDQSTNDTGGYIYAYTFTYNYVALYFNSTIGGEIDFVINVYGVQQPPNDVILGQLTDYSSLAKSARVFAVEIAPPLLGLFQFYGNNSITKIEALDQSGNGTTGFLTGYNGGVNQTYVEMLFVSYLGLIINFHVNVYVEVIDDLTIGEFSSSTVLLKADHISIPSISNTVRTTCYSYNGNGNHHIAVIQALDQTTNGTGGRVRLADGGLEEDDLSLNLRSSLPGYGIDFQVVIYGESTTGARNFRFGYYTAGMSLVYAQRFCVTGIPNERVSGTFFYIGSRTIAMFQGFDQFTHETGAVLTEIGNGVNHPNMTLIFLSDIGWGIDFFIEVYEL